MTARQRLTAAEISESDRLRIAVLRAGIGTAQLMAAAGCTGPTIRDWLDRQPHLKPKHQQGIRGVFSRETGGPG